MTSETKESIERLREYLKDYEDALSCLDLSRVLAKEGLHDEASLWETKASTLTKGVQRRVFGTVYLFFYVVKNSAGEILDSNFDQEPAFYLSNTTKFISGVVKALKDMKTGEARDLHCAEEYGHGSVDPALSLMRIEHPAAGRFKVGDWYHMTDMSRELYGKIVSIDGKKPIVDFNHPLAGQTLFIHLKLVESKRVSGEELEKYAGAQFGAQPTLSILRPYW